MNGRSLLACLGITLLLMATLVILILDIGGWGTFALDIAKSIAVQAIVAIVLLGIALVILTFAEETYVFSLSGVAISAIFSLVPLLALPALPIVFKRPVDIYDGLQTLVLGLVFYRLAGEVRRRRVRSTLGRSVTWQRAPSSKLPPFPTRSTTSAQRQLYQRLLAMAMGDTEKVERLIEYERRLAPYANREELLHRAIVRWERDIR